MAIQTPATTKMVQNIIDGTTVPQKALSADTAANVSQQINGKAITNIFESDGLKVKNATLADNAANVTTNINGKAITGIFESDGTTVKKAATADRATTADKVANALTLQVNENSTTYNGSAAQTVEILTINPNLLINPNFKINQRAKSTYGGGSEYSFDRWYVSGGGSVRTSSNGEYISTQNNAYLYQYFENDFELDTDYTFSVLFSDGVTLATMKLGVLNFKTPTSKPTTNTTINYADISIPNSTTAFIRLAAGYNSTKGCYYVYIKGDGAARELYYAKLEKGNTATTFVPPDMATELLKCQRYYVRYYNNGNTFGNGFSSKDTIGFILIVLPAVMRETPTCKLSGVYSISANHLAGSSKPVTFYGNLNFNMNSVKFEVQGSGFTVNEPIMLQIRASDGYIEFDSEI